MREGVSAMLRIVSVGLFATLPLCTGEVAVLRQVVFALVLGGLANQFAPFCLFPPKQKEPN